jgi:glyoxylase-like metal-dependent hydrolase (beta-lactamase superfamily II)
MVNHELSLIDLDQDLPGQRRFISCWLSQGEGLSFIVDPGPTSSIACLLDRLQDRRVEHLDFILLTHIHLDHAGGTAEILRAYPEARVFCHERGRRHLVDPTRLWRGSCEVLGGMAAVYGEPDPVPERALAFPEELLSAGIVALPTPGHAAHHLSFLYDSTLFLGEAAGTFSTLPDGGIYLRPATPPRFYLETALASLTRLLAISPAPQRLAFAHYGLHADSARDLLRAARDQHQRWAGVLRQELARVGLEPGGERTGPEADDDGEIEQAVLTKARERLLGEDPYYSHWTSLTPDIQEREQLFTFQSLQGFFGDLLRA